MPDASLLRLSLLLLLAWLVPLAGAAETARKPITAQDLWAVKRVGAPALSPDGRRAVVGVQEWSIEKNKPSTSLWLVEVASGKVRRLTAGDSNDGGASWSHDGSRIAFVSQRASDAAAALYVIPVDGGEAERVLELPYGVGSPRWLPGDGALVFGTRVIPELAASLDPVALAAMKKEAGLRRKSKMTAYATEVQQYRWFDRNLTDNLANRLLRLELDSKRLTDLTPGYPRLFSPSGEVRFDVAPDGQRIVLVIDSSPAPFVAAPNPDLYVLSSDGKGAMKNLTTDNPRVDDAPRFTPDGKSLLFVRQQLPLAPGSGELRRLWRYRFDTGRAAPIAADLDLSIDGLAFSADGRSLWLQAEEQGRVPVFRMDLDGSGFSKVVAGGSNTDLDSAQEIGRAHV